MARLRQEFATLNLDAGASLGDLQDTMGQASPRTTRRYAKILAGRHGDGLDD